MTPDRRAIFAVPTSNLQRASARPEDTPSGDELLFQSEDEHADIGAGPTLPAQRTSTSAWKVLVVDDEPEIHKVTALALRGESLEDREIELFAAYTAEQARHVLTSNPDVALVLLDVVMESERAGLELVRWIRKELRNRLVRIVLRTGQQGVAPEDRIMAEYEINDYWSKTDMTAHRLVTVVKGSLRAYRDLCTIGLAVARRDGEDEEPKKLGRYVVLKRIGAGGMGVVYAAYDPDLDRKVAVKLMHASDDADAQLRLQREAQAMARLSHSNVVAVFDVGTHEGRVFLAMDFIKGITLTEWIARKERSWEDIIYMFSEAGRGLAAAHEAGLVHRDFKPDNVLVGRKRQVKVTDFGLVLATEPEVAGDVSTQYESIELISSHVAPRASGSALSDPLTETGVVMGTPNYMAPEQHLGQEADARTDQFSFCMALYEALYQTKPFTGSTLAARLEACFSGQIVPAPRGTKVPARVRRIVLRGLHWDQSERWPSINALLNALERPAAVLSRRVAVALGGAAALGAMGFGLYTLITNESVSETESMERRRYNLARDLFERARRHVDKDPEGALAEAEEAAHDLEALGDAYKGERDEIRGWIAEQRAQRE